MHSPNSALTFNTMQSCPSSKLEEHLSKQSKQNKYKKPKTKKPINSNQDFNPWNSLPLHLPILFQRLTSPHHTIQPTNRQNRSLTVLPSNPQNHRHTTYSTILPKPLFHLTPLPYLTKQTPTIETHTHLPYQITITHQNAAHPHFHPYTPNYNPSTILHTIPTNS